MSTGKLMRILSGLAVLPLGWIYGPTLAGMVHAWRTDSYAGHGMFVPLFSALFLWMDRARIRAAVGEGDLAGFPVIVLALGILALGRWADATLIQGLSVVVAVAGIVLVGFGRRCLRQAVFPIGFLLFMVPLPRAVVGAFTLDLQRFAAGFAGNALQLFDIPVYQTGVFIALPTITLKVSEVCNGLRFLTGLLMLTTAFAHVSQRALLRKLVLIAAAPPIAILANAVRVAMIGVAVHYLGPEAALGFVHNTIAKVVWALTFIPLFGLGMILRRGGKGERAERLASRRKETMSHQDTKGVESPLPLAGS